MEKYGTIDNCNNTLLEQQKQDLIDEIINGKNKDSFMIYDIEAGCRKTRTAEIGIAKKIIQTDKNVLFVRRTDADCKESAEIINSYVGECVALDYNNNTVHKHQIGKVQKTFPKLRVLIITHQKYRELAKNKSQRNIFTCGRQTLVIDEFISDIRKLILTIDDIEAYKAFFKQDNVMYELFLRIIAPLEDYYKPSDVADRGFTIISNDAVRKNIPLLLRYIKSNFKDKKMLNSGISLANDKITTIKQLCSHIEDIKEFYFRPCYVRSQGFYTTDSKHRNWLLDNNILLDASGVLQIAYNMNNKLYRLKNYPKVLDHSHWKLHNIVINTTSSGKSKILKFYDIINSAVVKMGVDETLVIGNQADMPFLRCPYKSYFGNITGSNEWSHLKNIIIIQTHNLDDVDYILKYLHHASEYVLSTFAKVTTKSVGRNMTTRYAFADPKFERIRCLWIAEQTYQALKRVNRNMKYATDAMIYMNNEEVIELLKSQLVGCEVISTSDENFKFKRTKRDKYIDKLQSNSHSTRFTDLLVELANGQHQELTYTDKKGNVFAYTYAKKTIREHLGICDANTFNMCVLSNTQVVNFCNVRGIEISNRYIKIPS